MSRRLILAGVLFTLFASLAAAQDAKTVIASASKAMGADTLNTIEFSGSGADFAIGQAYNGNSPWPKFIDKTYTRAISFDAGAGSRMERIRMQGENPPHGGGQQPIIGEQPQTQFVAVGPNAPWVPQLEIWMTPHGFLKAAASRNATAAAQTMGGRKLTVVNEYSESVGGNPAGKSTEIWLRK